MSLLARRNLFHDKVRFAVTLTGIVFALVLIIIQFGLFLGFTTTTSNNIDHSNADLWVVFHGVGYFDTGRNFSERKFYQVLSTPGVERAEKYMQAFARWKRPDGSVENVQVIGFRPGSGLGEPWNMVQGSVADLKQEDSVIVDEMIRVGRILGKKNVRTDEPSEHVDRKILETLVELDPGQPLPLGLRVDSFTKVGGAQRAE
jgi:putative ABC transport system permease protein